MEGQQVDLPTMGANNTSVTRVKDLLPFLLHVPATYFHPSKHAKLEGFITDGGYACACPASAGCGYHGKVLSARQFEKHAGAESNNPNGHILLRNGKSLYQLFHDLRHVPAEALAAKFLEFAGVPMTTVPAAEASPASWEPNGIQVDDATAEAPWAPALAASGDVEMLTEDDQEKARLFLLDSNLSPTSSSLGSAAEDNLEDYSNESASNNSISNSNWGASRRRSVRHFRPQGGTETSTTTFNGCPDKGASGLSTGTSKKKKGTEETRNAQNTGDYLGLIPLSSPVTSAQGSRPNCSIDSKYKELKMRDTTLHPLIFKEGGLPDNTLLTYKLKNGEVRRQGYKKGTVIVCNCCNEEYTPSAFENHAGMGERRQPYHNIYTSEGVTLHDIALQLHRLNLNSNGFGNASVSSFSDYPNLTSSGCGKEPSTTSGPIVPLKRTLQERVVQTESCYFCRYGDTEFGKLDPNTIFFCNQCERPCHVRCYNSRDRDVKKVPLEILKEYMCFRFLCCEECQSLRARLEGVEKCEEIAFLRQIRSNICWRLLSKADASRDVKLYMSQAIDIFKDAFVESTDAHSDIFSDMVYGKNGAGEKDFRGMYCVVLTASTHVVSAAILKVRVEQFAELVLIATRSECRKKGYFRLLLKSIEANLRACNVSLLMAPVDPEMAQIWSEKLGFTILSAEEKKSMLESHPLVMFQDLVLVQKPLA
ncbi:hypothetical protein BDA96_01G517200 [Sorghum bicolor]|uniref:N-acetyltransferase domain-containing protein n=1 Tax=Sorghum bicolor TaxID=4558 RepID=A0A921S709_SORBI|nr:hypothetical protein BDA96_01G517200 [Sorghum bicolor]